MPAPRNPDSSLIEDALAALGDALAEAGAPWMVIGGIAVIAHGVQRMTTDIDVVIQGDGVQIRELLSVLRQHQILPRIDDAEAFATTNLVLLARHQPTQVDLDLSFGWTAFERDALALRASTRYGAVRAPMARVEELLVFKAIAGRSRDVDDAVTLLTLYPHVDLEKVRLRATELAELAEAPELLSGLEAILRALGPSLARRKMAGTVPSSRVGRPKASKTSSAKKTPPAKKAKKAKKR
ncbi:MAG TPA: hypothetical protein VGL19_00220 [Polyangiaceae bacterium]